MVFSMSLGQICSFCAEDPLMQFTQHLRSELEAPEGTIDVIFFIETVCVLQAHNRERG